MGRNSTGRGAGGARGRGAEAFLSLNESHDYIADITKDFKSKLDPMELLALRIYTTDEEIQGSGDSYSYDVINKKLRTGGYLDEGQDLHIDAMSDALKKAPVTGKNVTVERGFVVKEADQLNVSAGQVYEDKGFMSTSTKGALYIQAPKKGYVKTKMVVQIPKGHKVPYLDNGIAGFGENEVLFNRGTKYRVDRVINEVEPFFGQPMKVSTIFVTLV